MAVRPGAQPSSRHRGVSRPGGNRRIRFADKYQPLGVRWVTSSLSPARPASAGSSPPPPAEIGKRGLPETPARSADGLDLGGDLSFCLELSVIILEGPGPVPISCLISPVLMACYIPVRVLYMILYFLIHFNLQVGI